VVTSASNRVIRASAGPAWRLSPLRADVGAIHSPQFVIRELRSLLNVCVFVVLHSIAGDMSAASTAVLVSVKPLNARRLAGSHALWTQQPKERETTLKQNIFARVPVVAS
jgi:hypothetical protein